MIPGFHGLDLVVILVIALLIFGPRKLPEMGSAIGKSIKEFRKGMNELTAPKEEKEEEEGDPKAARAAKLAAIEREIEARKAAANAAEAAQPEVKAEASAEKKLD
ncbi:twin-arginine translocase TatA/TatE family subunit [Ktedonosporobacter rubrisoli]|uniref:Sec-independent protein translocase protein TatA n=1 Tax=Ktedonosporobacter rubrisoli TaxID=2509675 RepID=A0A4P6JUV7_KTERU|nr:twin-arginine translocase TatA/TatE family subunit [Ktedonosporobacter rubrisoli]